MWVPTYITKNKVHLNFLRKKNLQKWKIFLQHASLQFCSVIFTGRRFYIPGLTPTFIIIIIKGDFILKSRENSLYL